MTLKGITYTVTRVEHDTAFNVTSCKVDPPSAAIVALITDNIKTHCALDMFALEQAFHKL